jgi:hypothetical protein
MFQSYSRSSTIAMKSVALIVKLGAPNTDESTSTVHGSRSSPA